MFPIKMSVKTLVEFLYQHGDLTSSFLSAARANIGSKIHRMLQKQGGASYQSEVFLKEETEIHDILFIIDGRADGIIDSEQGIIIDEIKTTTYDFDSIHEDMNPAHWAQAYGYAYMYAKQQNLSEVIVQLTYYQIDVDQYKQFQRRQTLEELTQFYMHMLYEYEAWAMRSHTFHELRDASLQSLSFPYDNYRQGQRELAVAVYKTILDEDVMFAQAPTGIGKTVSVLFPALKALGEGKLERIFYLCAKNITATVAKDCIHQMMNQGLRVKTVAIQAKEKMCLMEEQNCDPNVCPYAKGYYDKLRPALAHLLDHHDFMDRDLFQEYGETHQICPFELSLDASLSADVIIGDYNYAFDPRVYLKRFFSEPSDHILLIDEAHNMVERARSMYSAQLERSTLRKLYRLVDRDAKACRKQIRQVIKALDIHRDACGEQGFVSFSEADSELLKRLNKLEKELDLYLQKDVENSDEIKTIYFELLAYTRIADFYDEHFITWVKVSDDDVSIKQYCMNPARCLTRMLQMGKAAVFFSATLTPIRYFTDLLLEGECTKKIALPSPFDPKRTKMIIHQGIDTRYRRRKESIAPICRCIANALMTKSGNYIVFFPSYAYLNQVAEAFTKQYPDIPLYTQESDMDETARQDFLSLFHEQSETMVFFCVLGGMFAEGIDFKGESLIGVIIVGVGLPQINEESDLLKAYFEKAYGKGYAYAYQYPGMNKVLQAVGRLIRDANDCGIILLLDERYNTQHYRALFPAHLRHYEIINDDQALTSRFTSFWNDMDSSS